MSVLDYCRHHAAAISIVGTSVLFVGIYHFGRSGPDAVVPADVSRFASSTELTSRSILPDVSRSEATTGTTSAMPVSIDPVLQDLGSVHTTVTIPPMPTTIVSSAVQGLAQKSAGYNIKLDSFHVGSPAVAREEAFRNACANANGGTAVWSAEEQMNLCGHCMLVANFFMAENPAREKDSWGTSGSEAFNPVNPHSHKNCKPSNPYCSIKMYYESAVQSGCCVTILHDGALPQEYMQDHGTDRIRFAQVDVSRYDHMFRRRFNLNDVRYFPIHEIFCNHKGWQKMFFTDIFDVKVGSSPCMAAEQGELYVGVDNGQLSDPWLEDRFRWMGGDYLNTYTKVLKKRKQLMWSAGIIGAGDRDTMADFLAKLLAVLTDDTFPGPTDNSGRLRKDWYQGVNMAAVNFVAEHYFKGRTKGGAPVNSKYRGYERDRHDVWFIHK